MKYSEALAHIGRIVTYWDEDSQSYVEGKLLCLDSTGEEVKIRTGLKEVLVGLDNVHSGTPDEIDANYAFDDGDIEAECESSERFGVDSPGDLNDDEEEY